MTSSSSKSPFRCPFPFAEWFPDTASPVRRAWDRSAAAVKTIQSRIDALDDPKLAAVALSGSLGRMEGREDSDWDLIFLLRDDAKVGADGRASEESLREVGRSLWERLDPEGSLRPEPNGIFAWPITCAELADPAYRESLTDSPARFGKRIQLLLDAQPICGEPAAGRQAALRFYGIEASTAQAGESRTDGREGIYLFNDLVRYHRSLCTMTQWLPGEDGEKNRRLKLKLRFTRFLNYLGLLLPLAQAIDRGNVGESLSPFWNLTPLERVLSFANDENEAAVEKFCRSYEAFLGFLEYSEPAEADWSAIELQADRFRESACELLRSQPFLQRGRAADLLLL
jgi:hypothetical protein